MSNEILQEMACPNCRNPLDLRGHSQLIICEACGSHFLLQGHLCPFCQTYHAEEELVCSNCGAALTRMCRKCGRGNWSGDEFCATCGSALDILDVLERQDRTATRSRLQRQMEEARQIKELEEAAARQRLADLQALEEQRLAEHHQEQTKRLAEERKLLLYVFGGVGILLLIIVVYTIVDVLF
ncbi:MAG: zinc ribbon domain-containing protein [Chloroflexota bacterium]